MSMAPSQLGAFTRSSTRRSAGPNLEYHVQPLSLDAFGEPLHRFPAFTASVCNLNPSSRGHGAHPLAATRRRAGDPPNYLSHRRATARWPPQSLRLTRRIVAQPALARYRPREVKPGVAVSRATRTWRELAGDIGTTIFHPVGTCRMGPRRRPDGGGRRAAARARRAPACASSTPA